MKIKTTLSVLFLILFSTTTHAYYQAEQGRWLNRDPVGERGGENVYSFVLNAPISLYDYIGLDWKTTLADIRTDLFIPEGEIMGRLMDYPGRTGGYTRDALGALTVDWKITVTCSGANQKYKLKTIDVVFTPIIHMRDSIKGWGYESNKQKDWAKEKEYDHERDVRHWANNTGNKIYNKYKKDHKSDVFCDNESCEKDLGSGLDSLLGESYKEVKSESRAYYDDTDRHSWIPGKGPKVPRYDQRPL